MADTVQMDEILRKFPQIKRNALIPLLQEVQDQFGHITEEAIIRISAHLCLPASKVFGLATFYNQFSFSPRGEFHITLCNGSACHLGGAGELVGEITKLLGILDGETNRDRTFSLEVQSCIGACGKSPIMAVNGTYYTGIGIKEIREIVKQYQEDASG